ncbi:undecaprenyl phosphate-alpha-L-ara4N flippase subunit ArnE [Desulfonatronum zhilinae]|nr:undecaprenyl phosphate-alpha-L-ara4N flippase subunit ArnE [Desulfonatronum zhilinae]
MTSALLIALFLLINTTIAVLFKTIALGPGGSSYMALVLEPRFYFACILFAAQAAIWLAVLRRLPLSQAYPFTSLNVVITLAIAAFFFNESITLGNLLGAVVIMAGVWVIARGEH